MGAQPATVAVASTAAAALHIAVASAFSFNDVFFCGTAAINGLGVARAIVWLCLSQIFDGTPLGCVRTVVEVPASTPRNCNGGPLTTRTFTHDSNPLFLVGAAGRGSGSGAAAGRCSGSAAENS